MNSTYYTEKTKEETYDIALDGHQQDLWALLFLLTESSKEESLC